MSAPSVVDTAITTLARDHSGRVLALLANRFGRVDIADDAVQDALVRAGERWPEEGVPDNPPAWLMTVARRRAIDLLRMEQTESRRSAAAAFDLMSHSDEPPARQPLVDDDGTDPTIDDQLRLMFLCCHPALNQDAQMALTLRLIGGLSTDEVASAFLIPRPTVAQRISRAKAKIRDAGIPLAMPADPTTRLDVMLTVLYLVFNEGYLSRSTTGAVDRPDLCDEAIRLTSMLAVLLPDDPEVLGLAALMAFHRARRASRFTTDDDLVRLDDQDRTTWDLIEIDRGNGLLHQAMQRRQPGRHQMHALIASYHANARTSDDTDWPRIVSLYEQLLAMDPSPVIALNHAAATAMADGPLAGLQLLNRIDGLDGYHLFHATRAELLDRSGDPDEAVVAWLRAAELTTNPAEQRLISARAARPPDSAR